ncbi:MAG: hypothetical protein ACUVS2_11620 [Candidatus Flexifilum sp.]
MSVAPLVVHAQSLVVLISPSSGPPGTVFTLSTAGGGFEGYPVECTVNGMYVGTFDYYGVFYNYQVSFTDPPGTVYTIYCYQPTVPDSGPLAGYGYFTVTAADADGDGISDGQDLCPQDFGAPPSGCPDSDGDGVIDPQDACPFQFGQTPNGCPPTATPIPPTPTVFITLTATPSPVLATVPAATLPPATRAAATATPASFVRPAVHDFPQFADCVDLQQQATGVAITELIRLSATEDPCGALMETLRRQRFGNVNIPAPLSQPLRGQLLCSTDPRSVPSSDYLWLDNNYVRMGSAIRLSWAGVSDGELCAAQAGDPFRLAAARGIVPLLDRAEYYTGVCYGILTAAQMREAMERLRAGVDRDVAALLISSLSTSSRLVGQRVWCDYLQSRILNISQAEVDRQTALLQRLAACGIIDSTGVDTLRARINEGQERFTWNELAVFLSFFEGRCPTGQDFLNFTVNGLLPFAASRYVSLPLATAVPVQQLFEPVGAPELITLLEPLQTTRQTLDIANCPTDSRSLPTPEMQALFDRLNRLTADLFNPARPGSEMSGVPDDGAALQTLLLSLFTPEGMCALMRGDPFGAVTAPTAPEDTQRLLWTTTCLDGAYSDLDYRSVFAAAASNGGGWNDAEAVSAVNAAATVAEKTQIWCSFINEQISGVFPPLPISETQQAALDYLGQCLDLGRWELTRLYQGLTGQTDFSGLTFLNAIPPQISISFEQFIDLVDAWRAENPNRCPTGDEMRARIQDLGSSSLISTIRDPGAVADLMNGGIAIGIIHEVICNRQDPEYVLNGRLPQGCMRINANYIEANTRRDRFEAGIPGVEVSIYRGTCSQRGSLVGIVLTDANGVFELGGLSVTPHCLSMNFSSGANPAALREGMWWTPVGVGGTHFWYTFTPSINTIGSIIPIPTFGWWRSEQSGDIPYRDEPTLRFVNTIRGELTTPAPNTVLFTANVYRAYCEPDGWDGTIDRVPPGCTIREDGRLIPDSVQQLTPGPAPYNYTEPGVANVTIAIFDGDCDSEPPDFVITTGADGIARTRLRSGNLFCIVADATTRQNAEALGVGRWVHTSSLISVSRIVIGEEMAGSELEFLFPWWLTGSGVPRDDAPIPTPPPGASGSGGGADAGRAAAPGLIPVIPVRDAAVCPPGGACTPVITIGRPAAPNAVAAPPRPPAPGAVLVAPPPVLPDPLAAGIFDAVIGTGWRDAQIHTTDRGVFIAQTGPDAPPNLFLLEGGGIFDIGQGDSVSEYGPAFAPDGRTIAFIGQAADDTGKLMLLDAETGAYRVLFSDSLGTALTDDTVAWDADGRTLYFTAQGSDGGLNIYQIVADEHGALPSLFLSDAAQPALTPDGMLMAFVRDGAIVVRFLDTGDEYVLTETEAGVVCEAPFFDANGLDLYFICRQGDQRVLYRQGAAGLEPITLAVSPLVSASAGLVSNTLMLGDGSALYLAAGDGSNALPFIELPDLRMGIVNWGRN